ncbi:MAG: tetratricopeptide repeat protein [Sphingomicrobium sp.]
MTGWIILLALLIFAGGALWLLGVRGPLLKISTSALLIGAAGYAFQGRPNLDGAPTVAGKAEGLEPLTRARHAFFGEFGPTEHWLLMSERMASRGNSADAAGILRSGVREHPGDPALWVGLGNALVDHAHVMTPPAELAFARAEQLAPGHPAAPFFRGLAFARSGDPARAIGIWQELLASAPADASWRPLVEDGVAALTPVALRQQQMQGAPAR